MTQVDTNNAFFIQSHDHAFFYAQFHQFNVNVPSPARAITALHSLDQALKALKADIPVLITGETGTGKDHFAQQLHQKLDADLPFISIFYYALL